MAQLTPLLLTVSCFSKIQTGFTFLVPAHLGVCMYSVMMSTGCGSMLESGPVTGSAAINQIPVSLHVVVLCISLTVYAVYLCSLQEPSC